MKRLPAGWHIYQRRRWLWVGRLRVRRGRKTRAVTTTSATVIGLGGLAVGVLAASPFSASDTLKHFASFPIVTQPELWDWLLP